MYDNIIDSFRGFWESIIAGLPGFLVSLVVLLVFVLLGKLFYRIFVKRIRIRLKDTIISSFTGELIKWAFYVTGIIFFLNSLGLGGVAGSLIAGAGVTALIFGFAFKDIAENLLSGILLAINRPFLIGDIIEVGGVTGPVQQVDLRTTRIKTVDGRDIFIPNAIVVKNVFTNYTRDGFLRLDFSVGLDTSQDIEKARQLIIHHLKNIENVMNDPEPNVELYKFAESSTAVKVMFWTNIFHTAKEDQVLLGEPIRSKVMREVKDLLLDNGFNLPSHILEHKMYDDSNPFHVKQS